MTTYYMVPGGAVTRDPIYPIGKRPVVVIDPEDREQVKRLIDAFYTNPSGPNMRAALRSLIELPTPPKPEEPTGLAAVVEDEDGVRWIRAGTGDMPWLGVEEFPYWAAYSHIPVVKVLSEGATS